MTAGCSFNWWHQAYQQRKQRYQCGYYPPPVTNKAKEVQYYQQEFDSCEIDATFHSWLAERAFETWHHPRSTFQYVIKADEVLYAIMDIADNIIRQCHHQIGSNLPGQTDLARQD